MEQNHAMMTGIHKMTKSIKVSFTSGFVYQIPLDPIAQRRAAHFRRHFGNSIKRSLKEDTPPLFKNDPYEAIVWAEDHMDWEDVRDFAVLIQRKDPLSHNKEWGVAAKEIR